MVTIDDKAPIKELHENPALAKIGDDLTLALVASTDAGIERQVKALPNIQKGGEDLLLWAEQITKAVAHIANGKVYDDRLADPNANWTNRPTFDERAITASRLNASDGGGNVTGEAAVLKVRARLGLGSIINVPLWHSGGWVSLKAPSNASILELNRRVSNEKITLGRITNGLIFSNSGIYIQSFLMNFVLDHVYDSTFGTKDREELKNIILITDLPDLVWGILLAMYPNGYTLSEPCVAQVGECNHVSTGKVNLGRMRVVDTTELTEFQMQHMSKRKGNRDAKEIERYQSEFTKNTVERTIGDTGISIGFKVPTLANFENIGFRWVDGVVNMVDRAFKQPLKTADRDAYITDQGRLSSLRQYSHWINSITVLGGEDGADEVYEDRDTIDSLCSEFSSDEGIRVGILNVVGEQIAAATVSVIGYHNTPCPACGLRNGDTIKEGTEKDEKPEIIRAEDAPTIIPMDLTTTFFTLCGQRINRTIQTPLG